MTSMIATSDAQTSSSSVPARLLNMFVSPSEVFDEVLAAPPRLANWLAPTLLVCLASLLLLSMTAGQDQAATAIGQLAQEGKQLSAAHTEALSARWQTTAAVSTCVAAFAGTGWSACILWFIGRTFLKTRFPFLKALELVGLAGMILVLGAIVTALLISASGNVGARPALSLLAGRMPAESTLFRILDTLNFFHLWSTTVLAIGLSRLSGVSFKEAAFWVFGYWVLARVGVILLG